jgi:hypothetical protein
VTGGDRGGSGVAEADRFLLKQKQYDPGRADRQQPRRADYGLP